LTEDKKRKKHPSGVSSQIVDKAAFGTKYQAPLLAEMFEWRMNLSKDEIEIPDSGRNLGSLDFQIASFLRFMQAKVSKACIVTLALPRREVYLNPCFSFASAKTRSMVSARSR
jgi:hypothetical protein